MNTRWTLTLLGAAMLVCPDLASQTHHVLVRTNMGDIKLMLYDDTPKHRDEFLNLVRKGHFNQTLFYRSVKGFVIQGGSSDSRNARPGQHIGYGDEAVNIDSEFSAGRIHKCGALCAPRQPDKINMFKTSDVSQFYIVCGRRYSADELDKIERSVNNPIKREIRETYFVPRKRELDSLKTSDPKAYNKLATEIRERMKLEYSISAKKEFTEQQRSAYTKIGGTPELDGEYTVFGEVVEGLDVVLKINRLQVDGNNRPLTDVRMTVSVID